MRARIAWILAFALVTMVARATDASVLGIAPSPPPIWHPARDLPRDAVFERLDATGGRLYEKGFRTVHELLELAVLNLCTERPEDREVALELLHRARERAADRFDLLLWEMHALHRARDATTAIALLRAATGTFEGRASFHYALGYAYWVRAMRVLDASDLARASHHFERACALQPDTWLHVRALAATSLLRDDPTPALVHLPTVGEGDRVPMAMLLLRAAILSYDPRTQEEAENLFAQALDVLPEPWAIEWITGGGRLPGVEAGDRIAAHAYWSLVDSDPTRSSNAHRLEFWRRFLVADLLWGDPANEAPGWSTEPGDIWVRWGRPTGMHHETPDIGAFVSTRGRGAPEANGPGGMEENMRRWTWFFAEGQNSFSLTFLDTSYLYDWNLVYDQDRKTLEERERDRPVRFVSPGIDAGFDLAVDLAMFLPSADRSRLITSVGILGEHRGPLTDLGDVDLDWVLFDARDQRIDQGRLLLDPSRDRDAILARVEGPRRSTGAAPARVAQFGLDLRPGRYRVAVEAVDQVTGGRRWTNSRFEIPARDGARPVLSDLLFCTSFEDFREGDPVPRAFVRYAKILVPSPERRFYPAQDVVFVYFEVYDLGVRADGRTRTTVEYRIEREGDSTTPVLSEFVDERTGRSIEGVVVKGTRLDLDDLDAGTFVLTVTVHDRVRNDTLERSTTFSVAPDPQ